mmetsp:Transcript_58101/g.92326  ORF Transcript_58101/g.92326 Transcript_58101/m.92326 type:complete len:376 (-) Transcript_58101:35-1162(-)
MLTVLGADRFQRLSATTSKQTDGNSGRSCFRSLSALGQSLGDGLSNNRSLRRVSSSDGCLQSGAVGVEPMAVTPTAKRQADKEAGDTGVRPNLPGDSRAAGLSVLSLRLSSTRVQQHLLAGEATDAADADKALLCSDIVVADRKPMASSDRALAFGEAVQKRSKAGHAALAWAKPADECGEGNASESFQPGRLAEWMELAVQHAPPSLRQQKATPGGLQDSYFRATRDYLTSCSLAVQAGRKARESVESDAIDMLVLLVMQVHSGQEGALLSVEVVAIPQFSARIAEAGLTIGAAARLLLHSRHPALTAEFDVADATSFSWPPPIGCRLVVRGFRIAGKAPSCSYQRLKQGPLLLPLGLTMEAETLEKCCQPLGV